MRRKRNKKKSQQPINLLGPVPGVDEAKAEAQRQSFFNPSRVKSLPDKVRSVLKMAEESQRQSLWSETSDSSGLNGPLSSLALQGLDQLQFSIYPAPLESFSKGGIMHMGLTQRELDEFRDTFGLVLDTPDWIGEFITRSEELEMSWEDLSSRIEGVVRSRMGGIHYLNNSKEYDTCSGGELLKTSEYQASLTCRRHQKYQEFEYTHIDTSMFNLGGVEIEGPLDLEDKTHQCARESFNMRRLLFSVITDFGMPVRLNFSMTGFHKRRGSFEMKDAGFILASRISRDEKSLAVMLNPKVESAGSDIEVPLWAPLGTWNLSSEPSFHDVCRLVSSALDLLLETELDGFNFDFTCESCETTAKIVDPGSKDRFLLASTGECLDCHTDRYDRMLEQQDKEAMVTRHGLDLGLPLGTVVNESKGLMQMVSGSFSPASDDELLSYLQKPNRLYRNRRA